ncbi:unnamed protein product [Protopolystoma xenopodis]|uniref:Uncharacterized protein n=1 Tax=Protopolystoma xenopodis TaxID=117903 RepID=A0A448XR52_9PLAT|nr:unnamed protein product [Protopolystoma xenopodis]
MERRTGISYYDAGEMSGNVPSPRSNSGNYNVYYGLRTR